MMSADLRCRMARRGMAELESNSGNCSLNCFDRLRLRVAHSASAVLLSMRIRFPGKFGATPSGLT